MWLMMLLHLQTKGSHIYTKPTINPFSLTNSHHQSCFTFIIMAASSVTATGFASSFHGSWGTTIVGEEYGTLVAKTTPNVVRVGRPLRSGPMMGNVNEGKGLFAPLVVVTRNIVGKKRFNQIRGKAIALHSQVITEFCKSIGADAKQRQGLIRLAKKNGEKLGFLA
ncbi:putative protein PROTON GRADIENT REGULATION 5 [Helianthus annuus]|nr:putative protein PROTON GRADIENT REGULATION 5 [Helianthus annuus]KAJ0518417.1 putative protein PROTON GRADIENT REGULATION 5 [Helianthus annuus]KAJ0686451.1 putative protein PROTON GRADIENT REGULATION 5 [Helianthus annuus]KAJ0690271.1 putative protein PROTON GRADIENT REGULATION 5 [Helianthus annuus]KAJ0876158.1 putative protein PROTON GRADIENT REGULATION 5 [Helianthus annuus]